MSMIHTQRKQQQAFLYPVLLGFILAVLASCTFGAPKGHGTLRIQCILPGEFTHFNAKDAQWSAAERSIHNGGSRSTAKISETSNTAGPRLIKPQSGLQITSYRLTCTSVEGEIITKMLSRASADITLKVGGWNILAEGLATDGSLIVENQTQIDVSAGRTMNLPINLHLAKGKGSVQITFSTTQAPNASWRYGVSLEYLGLPGDATAEGPPELSVELAATEQGFNAPDLPSGYYRLTVQLKDDSHVVLAGTVETILVLPGKTSAGSCEIVLTDPSLDISLSVPPLELPAKAVIGVDRYLNKNKGMFVPLAVDEENSNLGIDWFANGEPVGGSLEADSQLLAGYRVHFGTIDEPGISSFLRMDVLLRDSDSKLSQVVSHRSMHASSPLSMHAEWIQSIDYRAAMGRALHDNGDPANEGTGVPSDARWVAASPHGYIAVAGLDRSSAIHLFFSAAGQNATDSNGIPVLLPSESGWIRLWRDKVVVDKSERSPDRVSLSSNGLLLAAGSSSSNWLRIYLLDSTGSILAKKDMVSAKNGIPAFANIKALKFDSGSKRLFVLTNSPEKIMVFDIENLSGGEPVLEAEFQFSSCFENPPSSSLGMEDMTLLSNGWIAACSSNIARIFFVHYSDHQFNSAMAFSGGANGESLSDPKSIVFDEQNSLVYVLGYSKKLHVFSKNNDDTGYQPLLAVNLSNEFDKARSLELARVSPTSSFLVAGGGQSLGIIALDPSGLPSAQSSLFPGDADYSGIASIANIAAFGDNIVAAAGGSGLVSSFKLF